jgi:hypothetical protein
MILATWWVCWMAHRTFLGCACCPPPPDFDPARASEYRLDGEVLIHDPAIVLTRAKAARIAEIKRQAQTNIEALTWRLERAEERDRLGLPGETPEEVLLEREAIRRASNRCEAEINAAQDVSAVQAVTFAVTDADRATPARITRLQFLLRFTDAEMQAIVAAADANPALKAALLKWQTADGITLTDPVTQAGVQALEIAGLIAPGRAAQILAVE